MYQLSKEENVDFTALASILNENWERLELAELNLHKCKCLILVQGLVATEDAEIRRRFLNNLENEPNLML